VTTFDKLWPKFKRGKRYRDAFVAQHAKQEIGFQIRALMKQHDLTQTALARRAGLTQGVVSRAADPSYGNLTINTLVRMAAGFDVAFVGRFVPFSELPRWFDRLYNKPFSVPSFEQEDAEIEESAHESSTKHSSQYTPSADFNALAQQLADSMSILTRQFSAADWDFLASSQAPIESSLSQAASLVSSLLEAQQIAPRSPDNVFDFVQRRAQREAARGPNEWNAQATAGADGAKHA
jgi:transcriptional regulator with XRE-family HTH domain